jgi:hypothetical protein
MQLTWAERQVIDLKHKWAEEYELRKKAEERNGESEPVNEPGNHVDLSALRAKLARAVEKKDSEREPELAKEETERLLVELRNAQSTNEQLAKELDEARIGNVDVDQAILDHLYSIITARDARIEQLVKKQEDFTSEHFKVLKQANKDAEELEVFQERVNNQDRELQELQSRFACIETNRDWYVLLSSLHLHSSPSTQLIRVQL